MRQGSKGHCVTNPPGDESRVFQEQRDGGMEGSRKVQMLWLNFKCVEVLESRARQQIKPCPGEPWPSPTPGCWKRSKKSKFPLSSEKSAKMDKARVIQVLSGTREMLLELHSFAGSSFPPKLSLRARFPHFQGKTGWE